MKKTTILITLASIVLISGIISYRNFVPPTFIIRSLDQIHHTGTFEFDGHENNFGNSGGVVGGRMGWSCEHIMNSNGTTTFNLLKNGIFVKHLATV